MTKLVPIKVECYASYKAEETPRTFYYGQRKYRVVEVIDRWYEGGIRPGRPKLDYFKVKTDDHHQYIIRYNALFDNWVLLEFS